MTAPGVTLLALTVALVAVVGAGLRVRAERRRTRALLARLSDRLDRAATGRLDAPGFEETVESSLDHRLRALLTATEVTRAAALADRDGVQALIGTIAHQAKTPLTSILLYTELAAEEPLTPPARARIARVAEQAHRLDALIGSLITASSLEAGAIRLAPVPCPVTDVLTLALRQVEEPATRHGIVLHVADGPAVVLADRTWAAEALGNLLDNAIKYSPAGGSVDVSVTELEVSCRIDVTDRGIGIAEPETAAVFGRFYRSPAVGDRPGLGIGLWLARQIAHRHGGYLRVRSTLGEGSTFSLHLPRAVVAAPTESDSPVDGRPRAVGRPR